jgi:hypothetical protein
MSCLYLFPWRLGHAFPCSRMADPFLRLNEPLHAGLTPRQDALLLDLLEPNAVPVSLREQTVQAAQARLSSMQIESEDDIHVAIRRARVVRALGTPQSSSPSSRAYGFPKDRQVNGPIYTMLTLQLVTRRGDAPYQAQTLTFIELVSPEVKVCCRHVQSGMGESASSDCRQRFLVGLPDIASQPWLPRIPEPLLSGTSVRHLAPHSHHSQCPPRSMQDAYGLRAARVDDALQRSLSLAYASLASVLLALRSSSHIKAALRGCDTHHIPWRDSPLTKWLRPHLSTAAAIVLLATVAPGVEAAADTLATLSYVSRLRTPSAGGGVLVKPSWDSPARSQVEARQSRTHVVDSPNWPQGAPDHEIEHTITTYPEELSPLCYPNHHRSSPERAEYPSSHSSSTMKHGRQAGNRRREDHAAYGEVLATLRRAGGSLREEALLEQLVDDLSSLRAQVCCHRLPELPPPLFHSWQSHMRV